ncbi:hypothetical protein AMTRI_Chr09g21630 [Amborella trichopoda]|uniref:RRM domain-containing protein n=1 Tax=Amborella trichopoda TaxID=13333 RepID=W1Q0B1_AMBTC|nr:RNA-binding protein 1 [Amborella trichopoda]XP_011626072.1 RNA-binding protein 1 [Amborella trichopoda]XP_011626073.1 RNA-binding protein 1 [Amborella trichopoda]XP_011626074.1 RNA-binding protein 1 [Amborella trichopoda]ERN13345.1 hypothetical protein AMTR_s00041p00116460 [Amborella trichopoda]|eukprot:XP_006851878.1 RNA-binding protein 1 [Amborella trichopoda]
MGDFWRFGDGRQQAMMAPAMPTKRSRTEFDAMPTVTRHDLGMPGGLEMSGYMQREEDRGTRVIRDTESLGASYDRYLRSGQITSFGAGEPGNLGGGGMTRPVTGGMPGLPVEDPVMMGVPNMDPSLGAKGRSMPFGGGRPEMMLPPDASNTLFVEGLPSNCTRREVAHIFRPFVGFKEVRLVNKESRQPGGDPLVLCFVDFTSPAYAATALDALQGYKLDEHDRDSPNLRLQFARYPGPRSGGGPRGRR